MMKRWMVLIGVATVAVIGSYSVFAQQSQPQSNQPPMGGRMGRGMMMQGQGGPGGMMQGQGGPGGTMCPMCGAVGGALMQKTVVPVENGVIVAIGDKLIKYDLDLNKVREVAIDIDFHSMQQKMQAMMQNCPMHQQMMQRSQQAQDNP
ncbi:MAG: hypothetical protein ABFE01_16875 [Phycisphaerales bacterium]|jgi:hypothetical protein